MARDISHTDSQQPAQTDLPFLGACECVCMCTCVCMSKEARDQCLSSSTILHLTFGGRISN